MVGVVGSNPIAPTNAVRGGLAVVQLAARKVPWGQGTFPQRNFHTRKMYSWSRTAISRVVIRWVAIRRVAILVNKSLSGVERHGRS